jgi:hypothetical protein
MTVSILARFGLLALFALAACTTTETATTDPAPTDPTGWRMASGKEPTTAEFAALAATCEDQAKGAPVDSCLAGLGLKKMP